MIRAIGEVKRGTRLMGLSLAALLAAAPVIAEAQDNPAAPPPPTASSPEAGAAQGPASQTSFTRAELEKLLAPIALYPDSLLAQVLAASAYPIQIVQVHRWLDRNAEAVAKNDYSPIDSANWDPAVKAMSRFPDVVRKMSENIDWTTDLGDAFVNQPKDVADIMQELRVQAENAGTLKQLRSRPLRAASRRGATLSLSLRPIRRWSMFRAYDPVAVVSALYRHRSPSRPAERPWRSNHSRPTTTGTGELAGSARQSGPATARGGPPTQVGAQAPPWSEGAMSSTPAISPPAIGGAREPAIVQASAASLASAIDPAASEGSAVLAGSEEPAASAALAGREELVVLATVRVRAIVQAQAVPAGRDPRPGLPLGLDTQGGRAASTAARVPAASTAEACARFPWRSDTRGWRTRGLPRGAWRRTRGGRGGGGRRRSDLRLKHDVVLIGG